MDIQQPMQVDGVISTQNNNNIENDSDDSIIQNWENVRINAMFRE